MRLVYIDEAGLSNPAHEPFLVVAGIMLHADKNLIEVERHLDKLVARYIPPEHQDGFVFHATELFNGGGRLFKRENSAFPLSLRLEIADQIAAIVPRYNLNISIGFVKRDNFPIQPSPFKLETEKDKIIACHVTSFMTCAMYVEQWMRLNAPQEVCMLIAEDNQQARSLIRETHTYHQNNRIADFQNPDVADYFPFRKIKEEPLFQNKRRGSVLQLADFFAYVFKKFLMDDARYTRFIDPVRGRFVFRDDLAIRKNKRLSRTGKN